MGLQFDNIRVEVRKRGAKKTTEYVAAKLEELKRHWKVFKGTDDGLRKHTDLDPGHPYFSEGAYEKFRDEYIKAKDRLNEYAEELEEQQAEKHQGATGSIAHDFGGLNDNDSDSSSEHPSGDDNNLARQLLRAFENLVQNGHRAPDQHQRHGMKLPPVKIPTFNGTFKDWPAFHDMFLRTVHENESINKTIKMSYLKAHTTDEAAKLVQHLAVTENNYSAAWDLLLGRYNNKRLLVNTQLKTLISQSVLSVESANDLKRLHDTTRECVHALNNLGIIWFFY